MGLIGTLVIGLIAGIIAGNVMDARLGFLGSIVVGILGAVAGGWIAANLGIYIPIRSLVLRELILGTGGAILLIWIARLVRS